jgi:hypothetical protein
MSAAYKVLAADQTPHHGGTGKWSKGKWRSVTGELVPCANGIHYCRPDQLIRTEREYEFTLNGTVCGSVLANSKREAMEVWVAAELYDRKVVEYGADTVTVCGVTYGVMP